MKKLGTISGLSESRFVGRMSEYSEITDHLNDSIQGNGKLVFIVGEAGIGKTRLISELEKYAKENKVLSLSGRCLYQENSEPYLPFIDAFGEFIIGRKEKGEWDGTSDSFTTEDFFSMGLVGIAGVSSHTQEMYPDGTDDTVAMGLVPIGEGSSSDKPQMIPKINLQEERTRLFESLSQLVIRLSERDPLLLVLDDLQWADDGSLQLLHYLARTIPNSRVMICGAYRPEEIESISGEMHPLAKTLKRMRPENLFFEISLARFDKDDTAAIVQSMLKKQDIPNTFTDELYKESEGNPFFVEEVVKSLVNEGLIDLQNYAWETRFDPSKIHIPGTIRDVIGRRIDKLDDGTKGILRYASVIGNQFTFKTLFRISGEKEETLIDSIDALIASNMIHEDTATIDERYRFDHTQIREVIYNSMSRSRRRLMHKKIGEVIEEINKDRLDEVVYQLAHHFFMGKEIRKTLIYSSLAGEKATQSFAPEEALYYYNMAVSALEQLEKSRENKAEIIILLKRLGDISFNLSQWATALDYYNRAIILSEEIDNDSARGESLRKIGYVLNRMGEWDASSKNFKKALILSEKLDDAYGIADAHRGIGYIHWRLGEYEDAIKHYNECIQVSMEVGDMHTIALAFIELGNVHIETGDVEKGIEYYNKSLKKLKPMGDFGEMARAYNNLGDSYLKSGDYDLAIEYFKKCEDMGMRIGRKDIVGWSQFNAGEAYALKGDAEKALEYAEKSLDILTTVGDKLGLQACHKIFGMAYGMKKQWDRAIDNFNTCISLGTETNVPYLQAEIHYYFGKMYKNKGDKEKAKEQLDDAIKILDTLDTEEFMTKVRKELEDL
jgi:tetratricopeptide (TPR) repeat protein